MVFGCEIASARQCGSSLLNGKLEAFGRLRFETVSFRRSYKSCVAFAGQSQTSGDFEVSAWRVNFLQAVGS